MGKVISILILISVAQGIFFSISLLTSKFFKSKANRYFAFFILILVIDTIFGAISSDDVWVDFIWSIMWECLFPVMILNYVLHSLKHKYVTSKWLIWLYAPFVIMLIVDVFFALDYSFNVYKLPIEASSLTYELITDFEDIFALLYNIFVAIWAYRIIRKDKENPEYKIKWLKQLIHFIMLLLGIWFMADLIDYLINVDIGIIIWAFVSIFFWWVCYLGIHNLRLLEQKKEIQSELKLKKRNKDSKSPNNLSENEYLQKLDKIIVKEQLFKDVNLKREFVAQKLGISEGYLSQLINSVLGKNFTEYVNFYRIEAAKEMLSDNTFNKYSLQAIGMEAGFKSKSTFYTTFKKNTGCSPGVFQKNETKVLNC